MGIDLGRQRRRSPERDRPHADRLGSGRFQQARNGWFGARRPDAPDAAQNADRRGVRLSSGRQCDAGAAAQGDPYSKADDRGGLGRVPDRRGAAASDRGRVTPPDGEALPILRRGAIFGSGRAHPMGRPDWRDVMQRAQRLM